MPLNIVARRALRIGQALVVDGDSPIGRCATPTEADGTTGGFQALLE